MSEVPYEMGDYSYQPETTGGRFIRLNKKGAKVKIRIVSKPVQFLRTWEGKEKQNFAWKVIDRKDGQVKVWTAGVSIYLKIRDLAQSEDWGDPEKYDLSVERTEASTANYYSVTPSPNKSDLTKDEKKLVAEDDLDLIAICQKLGSGLKSTKTFGKEEHVDPDEIPDDLQ